MRHKCRLTGEQRTPRAATKHDCFLALWIALLASWTPTDLWTSFISTKPKKGGFGECSLERERAKGHQQLRGLGLTARSLIREQKAAVNQRWTLASWFHFKSGLNLQPPGKVRKSQSRKCSCLLQGACVLISCLEPWLLEAACHLTERLMQRSHDSVAVMLCNLTFSQSWTRIDSELEVFWFKYWASYLTLQHIPWGPRNP